MSDGPIERAKLRVSIVAGVVGIISLVITFKSYLANVDRHRIDRTFELIEISGTATGEARSEFQTILRLMSSYPAKLQSKAEAQAFYASFLKSYRGPDRQTSPGVAAWDIVLPLGDHYERVLLCTEEKACSKKIYCTMLEAELQTFAEVTREFRETSLRQQKVFAAALDTARKRVICD